VHARVIAERDDVVHQPVGRVDLPLVGITVTPYVFPSISNSSCSSLALGLRPGLALRKRRPGAWLFFWLILYYTAVYYAVFQPPRYRHPVEPDPGILIVYVMSEAETKRGGPTIASTAS